MEGEPEPHPPAARRVPAAVATAGWRFSALVASRAQRLTNAPTGQVLPLCT